MNLQQQLENNLLKFKTSNGTKIIKDGIVSFDDYMKSPFKILWVLKEANSDEEDWDIREALYSGVKNENGLNSDWKSTLTRVIYTTLGILNNEDWHSMGDFNLDPDLIDCLHKVAYINVKKIGGSSQSNSQEIQDYYDLNKEVLHEQISLINPNIIIFGNTMKHFDWNWLKDTFNIEVEDESNQNLHIYSGEKHILLNAYHPSYWSIKEQLYCDLIIDAVQKWKLNFQEA